MEWDWVHLTSMDTVNPVKFSFFFSFLPFSPRPLKKKQLSHLSFIYWTNFYLLIHSFIYLFISLNVRRYLTELLQHASLPVTVAALSGGLAPWFLCCVLTIICPTHASTHRVNVPSTYLGRSCGPWCWEEVWCESSRDLWALTGTDWLKFCQSVLIDKFAFHRRC